MIKIVIGTRPEIIKMYSIINECIRRKIDFEIIHSGQHYDYAMDKIFFDELKIPYPDFNLGVGNRGSMTRYQQINAITREMIPYINENDLVFVQGDTNTVVGGAKAALHKSARIFHVEAGVRSFNETMYEEMNRIFVDSISDYMFAPSISAGQNLFNECTKTNNVYITGNTVVDIINEFIPVADKIKNPYKNYILVTLHRQETVSNLRNLKTIMKILNEIPKTHDMGVVFPAHPRTMDLIYNNNIDHQNINMINPIGYIEFIKYQKDSNFIITDSGGIQVEACVLGRRCITVREQTEMIETLTIGANILTGYRSKDIKNAIEFYTGSDYYVGWENPYGDGNSGKLIMDIVERNS